MCDFFGLELGRFRSSLPYWPVNDRGPDGRDTVKRRDAPGESGRSSEESPGPHNGKGRWGCEQGCWQAGLTCRHWHSRLLRRDMICHVWSCVRDHFVTARPPPYRKLRLPTPLIQNGNLTRRYRRPLGTPPSHHRPHAPCESRSRGRSRQAPMVRSTPLLRDQDT